VGHYRSNHPVDVNEALPTVDSIPGARGVPEAAALDNGYWSAANGRELEARGIAAHIATGRESHDRDWQAYFAPPAPVPLPQEATMLEQMAYRLRTAPGRAIYRLRKSTVEPVIGIIKEVLGFRQFSLRGRDKVAGEWCLICLAYNVKRLHTLTLG
jgi:hypothetical protein